MFNIPEVVGIGGHPYKVVLEPGLVRNNGSNGNSCGNLQVIKLDPEMTQDMTESTFIHEVLHQLDYIYHLGLDHDQVYGLEAAIYAFLNTNIDRMKE